MKKLLTADELAELLSVDRSTVYEWARAGILPAYRVGRVVRFSEDHIQRWLSGHLVGELDPVDPHGPAIPGRPQRLRAAVSSRVPSRKVST